ncbi:MAG: hypothetical protein A2X13_10940 [Bacteroidetes bacterium GWC2_33_15]|nr:MAG: hypothetical protein A2X10_11270 [Bacteroidetes bacterium GWA2_33_15]OFX52561.1 MAG: hypothetical protein A2X13_10940 [Bacteroidetes bacterium GWC2_33_15]OFX63906.1 MAG: hypothetical protein A2X15_03285 [Bacteroidetes bacterium GWB2_32_14]OFX70827.1 MAG: hypothetical protein A2X14_00305 [Bacteroidetes bacterium GWD2_33_33]HAN19955.1 hypothetical protein [Bacteroidales bacterium]
MRKVYKFVHTEDTSIKTGIYGRVFESDWLKVEADGTITVKGSNGLGYAWDGCSPKFNFLQFTCGTPDGMLVFETCKPITYYASMFHDVLYQYKKEIDITRKETDKLFKENLKKANFIWWWLYYFAVWAFGWIKGKWKVK